LGIKKIVDTLVAIDSPITTEDHIDAILDGLPDEYDSFVTIITSRLDPYVVADVKSLILAQKKRLDKGISSDNFLHANVATRSSINQSLPFLIFSKFNVSNPFKEYKIC